MFKRLRGRGITGSVGRFDLTTELTGPSKQGGTTPGAHHELYRASPDSRTVPIPRSASSGAAVELMGSLATKYGTSMPWVRRSTLGLAVRTAFKTARGG